MIKVFFKIKPLLFGFSIVLVVFSCKSPEEKFQEFVKKQPKNSCWHDVHVKPGVIYRKEKGTKEDIQAQEMIKDLNFRYNNTQESANPAYEDTGIFTHTIDNYNINTNILQIQDDYLATTFVRKDINITVWTSFTQWGKKRNLNAPSVFGIIFKPLKNLKDQNRYLVLCETPIDLYSLGRYKYCGVHIKQSILNQKQQDQINAYVDEMFKKNETINTCNLVGIQSQKDYLDYIKFDGILEKSKHHKNRNQCVLSGNKEDFDTFLKAHKIRYQDNHYNWNEVGLRFPSKNLTPYIAALYYLSGNQTEFVLPPDKNYNIHLQGAQKTQQQILKEKGVFIPIIKIDMDQLLKNKPPFNYDPSEQTLNVD